MGKLGSKVVHCFCFFSLFNYFLLSCCSNSMRMKGIEDINESTSILPVLSNSKVDMANFVHPCKVAPLRSTFSHFQSAQNEGESSYFNVFR
jgi:hypothetical protein